ncbi:MAG: hypothetical protein ACJAVR_003342 [Paracoccaceae bacterium]|jgi:hypothetical protein
MAEYLIKSPEEVRSCALDWFGLKPGEALACSLGWTIVPQEPDETALRVSDETIAPNRSIAVLAGGRSGHVYHVSHRVRTSEGRALARAFLMRVVER